MACALAHVIFFVYLCIENQNRTIMKKFFAFLLLFSAVVLASCNSDVYFGSSDNIPKIVEKMMGMTPDQVLSYMAKEGFVYEGDENHAKHPKEYIFSKGAKNAQFSFSAPIVVWTEHRWGDTIDGIEAEQRPDSEKEARDLYWKWSHYTESAFASQMKEWYAYICNDDKSEIDYDNREQFWADYKKAADSLLIVYEHYENWEMPKDINMGFNFEDPGEYRLLYNTRSYIDVPVPCMPAKIRNGRPCY